MTLPPAPVAEHQADLLILGAGAAGLAAGIFAAEAVRAADRPARIVLLEGARRPGAKILVSGGGRCNVTHDAVSEADFCGGPAPLIRNVLRAFDAEATARWFASLGVPLKREPTGKLFPVSDQARTVLDALLQRLAELGAELQAGTRVVDLLRAPDGFLVLTAAGPWRARRVIVATGGLALPKSGSDGAGFSWLRALGHTIVPTTPALVALHLTPGPGPAGRFAELSGLAFDARLTLRVGGRAVARRTGSLLFTHFGVSGPVAMDLSRHWLRAALDQPEAPRELTLGHPRWPTWQDADAWLQEAARRQPSQPVAVALAAHYPERFATLLGEGSGALGRLTREHRHALARRLADLPLPVSGDRGFAFAEATAGGVHLREVDVRTMQSRLVPGLHLCGEVLDVDGYIGGYNFQWAWSTGYLAGRAAVQGMP